MYAWLHSASLTAAEARMNRGKWTLVEYKSARHKQFGVFPLG